MARARRYPIEQHSRWKTLYYPDEPADVTGDILEIGPGRGDFLFTLAEQQPGKRIVAIELNKRRYHKLIPRIEKRGLTNILLIQDDARVLVPNRIGHETFESIYVLFPDPWPKARHAFHRLLSVPFLWILARRLTPGGELILATDDGAYADWCQDGLDQVSNLEIVDARSTIEDPLPTGLPTQYEAKWRAEGRTLFFFRYRRSDVPLDPNQGPSDAPPLHFVP